MGKTTYTQEAKSGLFKSLVETFEKFVKVFKRNGLAAVTFILLMFLLFYSLILNPLNINDIVKEALRHERTERETMLERSVEQRLMADRMINNLMNELVDGNYGINRCLLFEIHNGSQNLSGVEYLYYSATNECLSNKDSLGNVVYDLDYAADNFSRQNISNFIGQLTYDKLRHEKYLYFPNLENYHRTSYRLLSKMHMIGANSAIIIPFVSNNIPMVLLTCTSKNNTLDPKAIYEHVEKYRTLIETQLMSTDYQYY